MVRRHPFHDSRQCRRERRHLGREFHAGVDMLGRHLPVRNFWSFLILIYWGLEVMFLWVD